MFRLLLGKKNTKESNYGFADNLNKLFLNTAEN